MDGARAGRARHRCSASRAKRRPAPEARAGSRGQPGRRLRCDRTRDARVVFSGGIGVSSSPTQPTEEELRAAYEAELKKVTVGDVVLQTAVSLINLAGRRLGVAPDSQDERELEQVRDAIDAVRGLMPVLERRHAADVGAVRDALA